MTYDDDTLGPCGCVDYHLADCPTRTGGQDRTAEDWYAILARRDRDDDWEDE